MEITGKIIMILPEQGGTSRNGNEWKKQEYVLETNDPYPKKVCFQLFGAERIAHAAIRQGEEVTVSFDIESREYKDKWYTNINAWKVERPAATPAAAAAANATPDNMVPPGVPTVDSDFGSSGPIDDLPF